MNINSDSLAGPEFVLDDSEIGCHPIGEILPKMTAAEKAELCDDIARNGLRDPLMMFEDLILDGRHRSEACLSTGRPRRARNFLGSEEKAIEYVISMNLKRRHLTESQRAWAAAELANLPRGRPEKTDNLNPPIGGFTSQVEAAQKFSVPVRTVQRAAKVLKRGIPELKEMVKSGDPAMPLARAETIASASPQQQKRIIEQGKKTVAKGRKASDTMLKKLRTQSLRGSEDGMRGCLRCDPDAKFDLDNISGNMQKIGFRAAAYAKENKTENYAACFESVVFEAEEIKLSKLKLSNSDKILAVIDRGTKEGEAGIVWEGDILRITKMSRPEFDDAMGYLTEYGLVQISFQQGKTDVGRGGKKKLISRADPKVKAHVESEDEPEEVYYDRDY